MKVAIIPARGGSKRIPRKNILPFAGKPIIAHSINCALQSCLFDRVIVSTEDEEIAETAKKYGAEVPFTRPLELAGDYTSTIEVISHALTWMQNQGVELSAICCIYPTAPFVQQEDLKKGLAILESGNWKFVFSATSYAYPIFRSFQKKAEGGLEMFFPQHYNTRSQDLPEALHDAGQFYWGTARAWLDNAEPIGSLSTVVYIPRWRVQDIDTLEDWHRAEVIWQVLQGIKMNVNSDANSYPR